MLTDKQMYWTNVLEILIVFFVIVYVIILILRTLHIDGPWLSSSSTKDGSVPLTVSESLRQHAIQKAGHSFSHHLTQYIPVLGGITNVFGNLQDQMNDLRNMQSPIRQFFADAASLFYSKIETYMVGLLYSLHRLRTVLQRSSSTFNLLYHTLEHNLNSFVSLTNSPPFEKAISLLSRAEWVAHGARRLCFAPHSTLSSHDTHYLPISEIAPGTILANDTMVVCNHVFVNTMFETLYEILPNWASHTPESTAYITGQHPILWPPYTLLEQLQRAYVRNKPTPSSRRRWLSAFVRRMLLCSSSSEVSEDATTLLLQEYSSSGLDVILPDGYDEKKQSWMTVADAFESDENQMFHIIKKTTKSPHLLYCLTTTSGRIEKHGIVYSDFSECLTSRSEYALYYNESMLRYLNACEGDLVLLGVNAWDPKKLNEWIREQHILNQNPKLVLEHPKFSSLPSKFSLEHLFVDDTLVLLEDGSTKRIDNLQTGDVLKPTTTTSTQQHLNTLGRNVVTGIIHGLTGFFTVCHLDEPLIKMTCTPYQKVFDPASHYWKFAWEFPSCSFTSKYTTKSLLNITCAHGKFLVQQSSSLKGLTRSVIVCDYYETIRTKVFDHISSKMLS
jgi:hypothetical protein